MAKISPTAAAKRWNKSKTTIYKMMNDGELSFSLNEKEKRVIDVSELVRVLGEPERSQQTTMDAMQEQMKRQNDELVQVLKSQVESQQEQIKTLTAAMERFSLLLEHQQQASKPMEVEQQLAPKEHQKPEPERAEQQPAKRKKSLFGRLLAAAIED